MTTVSCEVPQENGAVDIERDRALVLRSQTGDRGAFAELYRQYSERLVRCCERRLGDAQEAEDVTQEAFIRAWRALPRFGGDQRFYPWLSVIARNLCIDVMRQRRRATPTADLGDLSNGAKVSDPQESAEERVAAAVDEELVHRALIRLSARHRHVLELREESGWSYRQIAAFEGVEVSTIEPLLWRARQALRRHYDSLSDSSVGLGGAAVAAPSGAGGS